MSIDMSDWHHQVELYLRLERNELYRASIERLKSEGHADELRRLFGQARLTFGTAGIRGPMGPGFSQMNDLVVIQTSQGLVSYLLATYGEALCKKRGAIIGHDARHNSARFARLAALAFLQKSIPVYFCDQIVPTPLIAHGVSYFNCHCGLMITASHNPKQDNGYKVYWANGAQILSPHDANIQQHIMRPQNLEPWDPELSYAHQSFDSKPPPTGQPAAAAAAAPLPRALAELLHFVYEDLSRSYFAYIQRLVSEQQPVAKPDQLAITYSSMHGVGHPFLTRALQIGGFQRLHPVEAQLAPDADFPTVKFPNPEEAGALELAFETAALSESTLILANDPDADRCAAALYSPASKRRRPLSGNEIGQLLGWWAWHLYLARSSRGASATSSAEHSSSGGGTSSSSSNARRPQDCYMLSTAVSSRFLQTMARKEHFHFIETLTGFKYMGNVAHDLLKRGKNVLFAYEEAIGYMVDSQILDKDGVSAALQLALCSAYLMSEHRRSLEDQLHWLYLKYGYHFSINSYFVCREQRTIRSIFHHLQSDYPKSFKWRPEGGVEKVPAASQEEEEEEEFVITRIRDLNNGIDNGTPDHRPDLPVSPNSFMVTFWVADQIRFTIRTSGTEPKIKYYSEIVAPLSAPEANESGGGALEEQKRAAQVRLGRFVRAALERCLRPAHYKLEHAADDNNAGPK